MPLLLYVLLGLGLSYVLLLLLIAYGWKQLPDQLPERTGTPFVSVLIAARNEAASIPALLQSLAHQVYSTDGYEILLVDDHSTDRSPEVVNRYRTSQLQLLALAEGQQGKKQALALGLSQSRGEFCLTTDADCVLPPRWLRVMSSHLGAGADLVLAPVRIAGFGTFLSAFQGLDVAGTMLLTGAAVRAGFPALANGANLGMRRSLLDRLGGYQPNYDRSSGDDIFLLHAAARKGARITYCKSREALVDTEAVHSWTAFFQQRLRWAGKTSSYRHWGLLAFQGFVFGYSWSLLLVPLLLPGSGYWWGLLWGLKIASDALFLWYACQQVGQCSWLRWLVPASVLHTIYVAVMGVLALLPVAGSWKGRRVH